MLTFLISFLKSKPVEIEIKIITISKAIVVIAIFIIFRKVLFILLEIVPEIQMRFFRMIKFYIFITISYFIFKFSKEIETIVLGAESIEEFGEQFQIPQVAFKEW